MSNDTKQIVGKFQDLLQRFQDARGHMKFMPPDKPIPNQTIWCNGVEIPLDLPRHEFLARLKAAHAPPEPRQQT